MTGLFNGPKHPDDRMFSQKWVSLFCVFSLDETTGLICVLLPETRGKKTITIHCLAERCYEVGSW